MNVPRRPQVVKAGPKLEVQTPVRLTGPKVVRVEAPEVIEAPRPRRAPAGEGGPGILTSRGPRGGAGVQSGGGAVEEDRGRSPRRCRFGSGRSIAGRA